MNRIPLVRQAVKLHLNDISDLLAMRLLFPPDQMVVSIEKEIQDLYTYPERLETSHRDEWLSIAVKALHKHGFSATGQTDQQSLDAYLECLRDEMIPRCIQDHLKLFRSLEEVLAIQQAPNTITFPDPRRRALMRMIWPKGK